MTSAVGSVVTAAAQSVAKGFVIGGIGYAAVRSPLPALSPLNQLEIIGLSWWVLGVLATPFCTASLLGWIIPVSNPSDFNALRIAATFPNIVALPILIFPSLCEYEVVYEAFGEGDDRGERHRNCVAKSNTMIFCYFFGWSLLFWSCGHPALMNAAQNKAQAGTNKEKEQSSRTMTTTTNHQSSSEIIQPTPITTQSSLPSDVEGDDASNQEVNNTPPEATPSNTCGSVLSNLKRAIWQLFDSPPFIAMICAFVIGCITPIRDLFFSQGGALRFIGATAESLGQASSPMSTMVVAASLASRRRQEEEAQKQEEEETGDLEASNGPVEDDTTGILDPSSLETRSNPSSDTQQE